MTSSHCFQFHCNLIFISSTFFCLLLAASVESIPDKISENFSDESETSKLPIHLTTTSAGKVTGLIKATEWGEVIQYFGIPYAKTPLRFMPSEPLINDPLQRTILNYQSPASCMQPKHLPEFSHPSIPQGAVTTSEDCLTLNVFQPRNLTLTEKVPIMIFVPGDGYSFADMRQFDGSALALSGRIIVVSVNYRVGVFGFASMGNSILPGNMGLTDIISAIKFVVHNAGVFNGDGQSVTLSGRFTGAMAISTILASPLFYSDSERKQPLVKRIILHSGAAVSDYSVDSRPMELFQDFASAANCETGSGEETLKCLRSLDASLLQKISQNYIHKWRPAINGINLLKNPFELIEFGKYSKDIQFLIGDNFDSGSLCYMVQKYLNSTIFSNMTMDTMRKEHFLSLAGNDLQGFYNISPSELVQLTAHEFYYRQHSQKHGPSWRDAYLNFCGSLYIRNPVELLARYISRWGSTVYRYEFAFRPSTSIYPEYFHGALGDEITLLFPTTKTKFDETDKHISYSLQKSWTNFVKSGNPSSSHPAWEPFNEMKQHVGKFSDQGLDTTTTSALDVDVNFWRDVVAPLFHLRNFSDIIIPGNSVNDNDSDEGSSLSVSLSLLFIFCGALLGAGIGYWILRRRNNSSAIYSWRCLPTSPS